MPRLDPRLDFVFRQLLTRERVLLGDMLEGVLGRPVGLPTVVEAGIPGERMDDKGIALDVHAVLPDGSRASVEMQVRTSRTFAARLVYYGARNHSVQFRRGEGYEKLMPTTVIAWVVEPLFPALERLHTVFQLRGLETNVSLSGHLSVHLLQLSKPPVSSPGRLPCYDARVERWARFFNARSDAELDRLATEDPIMELATQTLDVISQDFDAYFRAIRRADAIAFHEMELLDSREEGREEGRAEILVKLLGLRFGPVPADVRARVAAATVEQLDAWVERVLTAATLDEVIAP
jgi:predicted transposase/invertase (TIGR01784 family)